MSQPFDTYDTLDQTTPEDLPDAVDKTPEKNPEPETKPRASRTTKRSTKRSGGRTPKPPIRKVAEKAQQIAEADEDTRGLLAGLVSAPSASIADLTTSIMESKQSPLDTAVADLRVIQDVTLPEATVHLIGMDRDELQALSTLVSTFSDAGSSLPEKIPSKATDAALALIEPVRAAQVDEQSLEHLIGLLAR